MTGARISVDQVASGENSTTVIFGFKPKKSSVSLGWRYLSRALLASGRWLPVIALSITASASCACAGAAIATVAISGNNSTRKTDCNACFMNLPFVPGSCGSCASSGDCCDEIRDPAAGSESPGRVPAARVRIPALLSPATEAADPACLHSPAGIPTAAATGDPERVRPAASRRRFADPPPASRRAIRRANRTLRHVQAGRLRATFAKGWRALSGHRLRPPEPVRQRWPEAAMESGRVALLCDRRGRAEFTSRPGNRPFCATGHDHRLAILRTVSRLKRRSNNPL